MKTCKHCKGSMVKKFNSTLYTCPNCHDLRKNQIKKAIGETKIIKSVTTRKVDRVVSDYIKKRDFALRGKVCLDCGKQVVATSKEVHWRAESAHYHSRALAPNLRYFPLNIHVCCSECNEKHQTDISNYKFKLNSSLSWNTTDLLDDYKKLNYNPLKSYSKEIICGTFELMTEKKIWTYEINEVLKIIENY